MLRITGQVFIFGQKSILCNLVVFNEVDSQSLWKLFTYYLKAGNVVDVAFRSSMGAAA